MLASDSDSDFEYPHQGANSDASSVDLECDLVGKLALGVDPEEMREYDGKSTPQNGSQYLIRMMAEKKTVPKVAFADITKFPTKALKGKVETANLDSLDRFLQRCQSYEEAKGEVCGVDPTLLPSSKWRENTISDFSSLRSRVERWIHLIESKELRPRFSLKIPEGTDNHKWFVFCFGQPLMKLAAWLKNKSIEDKMSMFFLDLYDESAIKSILLDNTPETCNELDGRGDGGQGDSSQRLDVEENTDCSSSQPSNNNQKCRSEEKKPFVLGHPPLMNLVMQLNQGQLEDLIKWNLLWLSSIGFVNECQGQWLYAVLACILKPVNPSAMSDIRSIARILIKIRNAVPVWNAPSEENCDVQTQPAADPSALLPPNICENERAFNFVNTLNLFIYIIADYFCQKDLITDL